MVHLERKTRAGSQPGHRIPKPGGCSEDRQGHDEAANKVQEDTGGPAGILKDTSPRRFGTVRPRVQNPGPPTKF